MPPIPFPETPVQFIKRGDNHTCQRCGATVQPEFFQLHRKWHTDNGK